MAIIDEFPQKFRALTGHDPLPWQRRLFTMFVDGRPPRVVSLPTGLGKSAVVPIWLLAVAANPAVKRRMVYVVDRRAVVAREAELALEYRRRLDLPELADVRAALVGMSATRTSPLAVSTHRGQYPDSGECLEDPSRPSLVVGTYDMVGSRLLFSGYADGRNSRGSRAGLLGCGTVLVHDEAHLSPAFSALVASIAARSDVEYIELSATPRGDADFALDADDLDHPVVAARVGAAKRLVMRECRNADLKDELVRVTRELPGKVVVYANSPETVAAVAADLAAAGEDVAALTGTMRGVEREAVVAGPVWHAVEAGSGIDARVVLVATAAGEVGADLSGRHGVSEDNALDSLAQRAGRVNRLGEWGDSTFTVVRVANRGDKVAWSDPVAAALADMGDDASPPAFAAAVAAAPDDALSGRPRVVELRDEDVELLSMSSLPPAIRPVVEPWIRGIDDDQTVAVAWRAELERPDPSAVLPVLEAAPIGLMERCEVRASEVEALVKGKNVNAVVFGPDGPEAVAGLVALRGASLVVLPPSAGGLTAFGVFSKKSRAAVPDVGMRCTPGAEPVPDPRIRAVRVVADDDYTPPRGWRIAGRFPGEGDEGSYPGIVVIRPATYAETARAAREMGLDEHLTGVAAWARRIGDAMGLPADVVAELEAAGAAHDLGKARDRWQRAVGAPPDRVLAKTANPSIFDRALTAGYRHELGSLLDAPDLGPLAYHLVATHHGRGRPVFGARAWDRDQPRPVSESAALRVAQAFPTLQSEHGAWRLALYEAVIRAADALGSV